MNERELSLIKVLGEEFGQVLAEMRDSFSKNLQAQLEEYEEKLLRLAKQVEEISNAPDPDIESMVKAAIAHLPAPTAPGLPDIATMVSDAVAAIPAPRDGKSVTPEDVQPMIQELVRNAVAEIPTPKDGKDFDPSMLKQLVEQAVSDAVSTMPAAEPGKDGADGRDALALEILPFIDEEKSYPRGSYATHNGGLWRAYEKTHGMRGWECLVDGVAGIDIQQSEQRCFTLKVNRTSGTSETKSFDVPVMIYQGVFKSGQEYLPGDTVTWGGSLWHCDERTQDKPGEAGSKGWTLAAKRGRDGRDKT
ncbi:MULTISPECIES: phage gp6-like head-tail connector protein [unclassified Enterobacter cloacae complex]|uniref:phage gp6-like head-tail connector protein n=1 Tax=unclassified Enterobacter cloacae complex TaxID=2757714 RepID=UPI00263AACE2|nr:MULTISPECIES: phage gp6-like head-tail connector protein [unclassified Enterobacter cloacae complex]MDN4663819.1 phage gp6-like head-tail connector protein [Enterobacter cloacae complex sp. 2023EL-00494]MDN4687807.1 phage gp6-like head-tail connector protein [Enterobacter cloacae complex sp. 2023EL-00495]